MKMIFSALRTEKDKITTFGRFLGVRNAGNNNRVSCTKIHLFYDKNRLHVTNLLDNCNLINIIINRSLIKTVTVNSVKK